MKVIALHDHGPQHLRLEERPMPQPGRQQILIRVAATSLNYRDVEIIEGTYHTNFALPLIPLSDGVGEIVAIGPDVTRFAVGDRVCSTFWPRWIGGSFRMAETGYQLGGPIDGLLAEFALLDEQAAVLAPKNLTDVEAATLPCAAVTAWQALVSEGQLKPGDNVLVQGTGGVSLFALQFAVACGARVIVTSSSDEKIARAKALGASAGINYHDVPDWAGAVLALTGGRGVEHVVEVGGPRTFAQSLAATAVGGQINVIGYLGGTDGLINPLDIFRRQVQVRGIPVGSRESFEAMVRAIEVNNLRPVVDSSFAWAEIGEALARLKTGSHFGKLVLLS